MLRILTALALAPLLLTGCGDKDDESACTTDEDVYQCTDDVLQECVDGAWVESEDCAAADMICHDMGENSHCMEDGEMEM